MQVQGLPLPRLGQIGYINCLPVTLPIALGLVEIRAEVEFASPADLNAAYAAGRLDLGAMSTSYYVESKEMTLIPRLSIASNGSVGSVLFFYRKEPTAGRAFRVAVPTASATSVRLLKILFEEEFGFPCEVASALRPDLEDQFFDGALVFGDHALAVDDMWSKLYARKDLGAWWKAISGLPMIFGVWAARTAWASSHKDQFEEISEALATSIKLGLGKAFPDVIDEAQRRTGLSAARLQRYYHDELDYGFGEAHVQAIRKYESLCRGYGLLARPLVQADFSEVR
jgi:chorismate dehydratase